MTPKLLVQLTHGSSQEDTIQLLESLREAHEAGEFPGFHAHVELVHELGAFSDPNEDAGVMRVLIGTFSNEAVRYLAAQDVVRAAFCHAWRFAAIVAFVAQVCAIEPEYTASLHAVTSLWNLDRLDQRARALDGTYSYFSTSAGSGVDVYIIDSGACARHFPRCVVAVIT